MFCNILFFLLVSVCMQIESRISQEFSSILMFALKKADTMDRDASHIQNQAG